MILLQFSKVGVHLIRQGAALVRRILLSSSFWALADQGVVSIGSFLTSLVLARQFAPTDFGTYGLVFGVILLLNTIQGALVNYPLSILVSKSNISSKQQYVGTSLLISLSIMPVWGAVLGVVLIILDKTELLPLIFLTVLFWQMQENLRRSLMAELRYRDVLWGDVVAYLLPGALLVLQVFGIDTTVEPPFFAFIYSFALASIVQYLQVRPKYSLSYTRSNLKVFWELGRWQALSVMFSPTYIQAFPWILATSHGLEHSAQYLALNNLLGIAHPIMFGIGNLLVPVVARSQKPNLAKRRALLYGVLGGALILPYFLFLSFFPHLGLRAFYPDQDSYLHLTLETQIYVVAYVLVYFAHVQSAFSSGLSRSQDVFRTQVIASIVAVTVGFPLIIYLGVLGAVLGRVIVESSKSLIGSYILWKHT